MIERKAKYVAKSTAMVLSLQIFAVCVFLFYPAIPAIAAAVIPVTLLVAGIMTRSRLAWWVGAVIFGLMGLAHAAGFLVQVLDPLLAVLNGRHPLFDWGSVHSIWIALLHLGSVLLVGLFCLYFFRQRCGYACCSARTISGELLKVKAFGCR